MRRYSAQKGHDPGLEYCSGLYLVGQVSGAKNKAQGAKRHWLAGLLG